MATHSSILAWRIPWTKELGVLQSTRSQRVGTTEQLSTALRLCFQMAIGYIRKQPRRSSGIRRRGKSEENPNWG